MTLSTEPVKVLRRLQEKPGESLSWRKKQRTLDVENPQPRRIVEDFSKRHSNFRIGRFIWNPTRGETIIAGAIACCSQPRNRVDNHRSHLDFVHEANICGRSGARSWIWTKFRGKHNQGGIQGHPSNWSVEDCTSPSNANSVADYKQYWKLNSDFLKSMEAE